MADKEATVYIMDIGRSMGRKHQGRKETDFDWAMRYVWDKITTTVRDHGLKVRNMDDPSPGGYRPEDVADRSSGTQNGWYGRMELFFFLGLISQVRRMSWRRMRAMHTSRCFNRYLSVQPFKGTDLWTADL